MSNFCVPTSFNLQLFVRYLPNYSSYPLEELAHKNYCSTVGKTFTLPSARGFPERRVEGACGDVAVSRGAVQHLVNLVDYLKELDVSKYETWEAVIAGLLLQQGNFQLA